MDAEYPDFSKNVSGMTLRFSKRLENGVDVYMLFRTFSDKDYIIPNFLWSKLRKIPTEDCIDLARYSKFKNDWSVLDGEEESFFSPIEFGCYSNAFGLDYAYLPFDRLHEAFSRDDAKDVMEFYQIEDWREETIFHSWDMIDELFPGFIKEEDVEAATRNMMKDVKDLVCFKYKEYFQYISGESL